MSVKTTIGNCVVTDKGHSSSRGGAVVEFRLKPFGNSDNNDAQSRVHFSDEVEMLDASVFPDVGLFAVSWLHLYSTPILLSNGSPSREI